MRRRLLDCEMCRDKRILVKLRTNFRRDAATFLQVGENLDGQVVVPVPGGSIHRRLPSSEAASSHHHAMDVPTLFAPSAATGRSTGKDRMPKCVIYDIKSSALRDPQDKDTC